MLYTLMVWTALGETESLERVAQTAIQRSMMDSLHLYHHYLMQKKKTYIIWQVSFHEFHGNFIDTYFHACHYCLIMHRDRQGYFTFDK